MYCVIALALFLPAILAQGGVGGVGGGGVTGQFGGQGGLNVPRQQFGGQQVGFGVPSPYGQFGGQFGGQQGGYGQFSPFGQGRYGQPCQQYGGNGQYGGGQYGGYPGQYGQQGGQFGGQFGGQYGGGQPFFDEAGPAASAAPAV